MKRLLPLLFVLVVLGCAVQRKESPASATPAAPPAEQDTNGTSAAPATGTEKPSAVPSPGGAGGMVVLSPEVQKAQANFDSASTAFSAAGNDCAQLCKALSSMTQATERLCELAATDARCSDAKTKLDAARVRVKSTCGTC